MFYSYLKLIVLTLFVANLKGVQSKECYSCEGINCLRTSKIANKATCVDPVDNCVTVFEGLTVVARGCYSILPEEYRNKCDNLSDSECHKCYKNLCNDRGAISCLQCSSSNNKECSSAATNLETTRCPISTSPNSYCYTRQSSGNIERGCLVDSNEQLKCLADNSCDMCIPDGEMACNRESVDHAESGSKRLTIYSVLILLTWFVLILL
ncbi:uncharacterized protein LOC119616326 [Lucilia sericata]|uniref:uncharacterized protein LOC119616326 n=1 Tax=Lucilia sericata TaxID=13632 RepID=UPI0018A83507|nr:uncharacterized protein LOC119616326 [Lucilia sericata]